MRILTTLLLTTLAGCFATTGTGTTYTEPSIKAMDVSIRRVAILPNRLPINLQDPEHWRRYNWEIIRDEFVGHQVQVIDYETSVRLFEQSGLPVEDTKSSRDKYADLAQQLGVDAIVIPYYGTFGGAQGSILIKHSFTSVGTLQVYLAAKNDFMSRLDANGVYTYTSGFTTLGSFFAGLLGGLALIPGLGNATLAFVGIGLAAVAGGFLMDVFSGTGTADQHWQKAFRAGIHAAMEPFFASLTGAPAGQLEAPGPPPPRFAPPPSYAPPQPSYAPPPSDEQLSRACTGGDARACVSLYRNACNGSDPRGCLYLGVLMQSGAGTEPNPAGAVSMFKRACEQRVGEGCQREGRAFEEGAGVARDPSRAATSYQAGCILNDAASCKRVAAMYRDGIGVPRDDVKASQYGRLACELDPASCPR